jgi:lactoylglutathione lyase
MLRVKNPNESVKFYEEMFGFKLIHKYDFPSAKFSLYFLTSLKEGEVVPEAGTVESEKYLWSMKGTCLELTHNYGSELDGNFAVSHSCLNLL